MAYREVGVVVGGGEDSHHCAIDRFGPEHHMANRGFRDEVGVQRDTPWPEEDKLESHTAGIGRRGATVADGQTEQQLKPGTDQIRAWLDKDHLLLTKVHELLGREGLVAVPDRSDLTEVEFGSEWFSPGHFPDC